MQFLEELRQSGSPYEQIAKAQAIQPWLAEDKSLQVDLDTSQLSAEVRQKLGEPEDQDCRRLVQCWLYGQLLSHGPKIFRPSLAQCLALEQVAPRIPLDAYAQPYPVMLVEFPEGYRRSHACAPIDPVLVQNGVVDHAPMAVLIGTAPLAEPVIWLCVLFDSRLAARLAIVPTDPTIEDGLVREFGEHSYIALGQLSQGERAITAGAIRLAVSAMLLLAEFGCKPLGPVNEAHYGRLRHYAQQARKRQRGVAEADRNLRLAPQLYGLAQEIVLHEHATPHSGPTTENSEETRRPHWRRGHWKMQPHGPALALRKRIFIKPVLVNGHMLCGEDAAILTTYRTR